MSSRPRGRATPEQRLARAESALGNVAAKLNEQAQKMAALSHQLELVKSEIRKLVGDGK